MKKTRGLYHVFERRYFNFSPGRFSEIGAILTAPALVKNGVSRVFFSVGGGVYFLNQKNKYRLNFRHAGNLCS
jgi:hypothetical protein